MVKKQEFYFESRDREHKIHAIRWIPEAERPVCIVQIVHGMAEYIDRYDEFASFLAGKGILVVGDDHLGHGRSVQQGEPYGYFCREDAATVLVRDEHRLKKMGEIMKYAEQYQANHIYHIRYQKSKDKDRYFRQHETELLLHDGAENMLRQWGLSPKNIDLSKLQSEHKTLISQKEALRKQFKSLKQEVDTLKNKQNSFIQYFNKPLIPNKQNTPEL